MTLKFFQPWRGGGEAGVCLGKVGKGDLFLFLWVLKDKPGKWNISLWQTGNWIQTAELDEFLCFGLPAKPKMFVLLHALLQLLADEAWVAEWKIVWEVCVAMCVFCIPKARHCLLSPARDAGNHSWFVKHICCPCVSIRFRLLCTNHRLDIDPVACGQLRAFLCLSGGRYCNWDTVLHFQNFLLLLQSYTQLLNADLCLASLSCWIPAHKMPTDISSQHGPPRSPAPHLGHKSPVSTLRPVVHTGEG